MWTSIFFKHFLLLYPTTSKLCVWEHMLQLRPISIYRHYICIGAFPIIHPTVFKQLKIFSLWYIVPFIFLNFLKFTRRLYASIHSHSPNRITHFWYVLRTTFNFNHFVQLLNTFSLIILLFSSSHSVHFLSCSSPNPIWVDVEYWILN